MRVVAFLQNQWFKDAVHATRMLSHTMQQDPQNGRERFIRVFLFYRCLTGKRLFSAFGESLCDMIIWENISPKIGDKSNASFPPDYEHIKSVLKKYDPHVVLTFGKIATAGLNQYCDLDNSENFPFIISGPHPAARGAEVCDQLSRMAKLLLDCREKFIQ